MAEDNFEVVQRRIINMNNYAKQLNVKSVEFDTINKNYQELLRVVDILNMSAKKRITLYLNVSEASTTWPDTHVNARNVTILSTGGEMADLLHLFGLAVKEVMEQKMRDVEQEIIALSK